MNRQRNFRLIGGGCGKDPKHNSNRSRDAILYKNLTENEKEVAVFFPLFGNSGFESVLLDEIIRRHGMAFLKIEDLFFIKDGYLSVRTQNLLLKSNVRSFAAVLMMTPEEIMAIKNMGKRAVPELQEIAGYILGI